MQKHEALFFHMAAMFYNSKTENVKRDNILKKIIENILVQNGNELSTYTGLSVQINAAANMIVVEDEIEAIVTNPKNSNFEIDYSSKDIKVKLKQRRFEYLVELSNRNISYYIKEFINTNGYPQQYEDLINQYIYNFYCKNINELSSLIASDVNVVVESDELKKEELEIVQQFLDWDNDDKNRMVHALANSALEYLLISGNAELLQRKDIKSAFVGKKIYVDTNILFYCLGINGEIFEASNRAFLKKCKDCKEEIVISYYTDSELKSTITHFVNELERLNVPLTHNYKVSNWITNRDVYSYYILWHKGQKMLNEPKYFKKYLLKKYEELIKEFDIKVERIAPFSEQQLEDIEEFKQYEETIICNSEINYDARNVFLVESKRTQQETNLQNTFTIFISADKSLQRWDNEREKKVPVVIAPNLWLLLLSRLVSRNDDDFKSFICFVNMINTDSIISNKEYLEVLKVINDIVEDVKKQEDVIEIMIEEEFAFLENGGEKRSTEFIVEKTTEETKRIITDRIDVLEKDLKSTRQELIDTKNDLQKVLVEQEQINDNMRNQAHIEGEKQEKEKQALLEENQKMRKILRTLRRLLCVGLIMLVTVPCALEVWDVFICKNPNPLSWKIINKLLVGTVCEPENINELYLGVIYAVVIFVVTILDVKIYKKLWKDKEEWSEK